MASSGALAAIALTLGAWGCGGAGPSAEHAAVEPPPIEAVRARARENPDDPAAWRALAEWELLGDRGDVEAARPAIERAATLAPADPLPPFLLGFLHEQQGRPADALAAWLHAAEVARASDDPLAPAVAEATLSVLASVERDVSSYDDTVRPVLERVVEEPGRLGLPARELAVAQLIGDARRRGDPARVEALASRLGCVRSMRIAGPFGPHALLGFDQPLPAEGRGPLAASYDLGPTRGEQPTREIEARGCLLRFDGGALSTHGGWVGEATLEVTAGGRHLLAVDTPNAVAIRLDGEEVAVIDRRRDPSGRYSWHEVDLTPGRHELEVKIATRAARPVLFAVLDRPAGGYDPTRGVAMPAPRSPAARVLRAMIARSRSEDLEARETLEPVGGRHAAAGALILRARAAFADPFLPSGRRQDEARRLLTLARRRDPQAWYPARQLARMEQGTSESLARMRQVVERWPGLPSLRLSLAAMLDDAGFDADADEQIRAARQLQPEGCAPLGAWYDALRGRLRYPEANALVDRLMECDARSRHRYNLALRQRRWDDARAELDRLRPMLDEDAIHALELGLAVATGDEERARELRARDAEKYPFDDDVPLREADLLLAAGQRDRAVRLLAEAIEATPRYMLGLERVRRGISGESWLDRWRVDGAKVIADYEASGRTYPEHGQVLVFDYMVIRIHADGSSVRLVHQIERVQSEESIERLGQLRFPGRLLTLRSIKPDGRRLEPDHIEGLDSIAMPSLAIGDYVEYEYLVESGPRLGSAFLSGGWWFQSFSQPFDLSRLVVLAPADLSLTIDARGPVPEPVVAREGDLVVRTWTVEESRPLVQEPGWVPRPYVLPFVAVGARARWEDHFDALRDTLADKDPRDPHAVRLVRSILRGHERAPVAEKVALVRAWLLENVEGGGGFDGVAPVMLHARTGSRTRLLRYLLELAGIEAHLVVTETFGKAERTELLDPDLYETALVMVPRQGAEPLWVWAEDRGAPLAYLPPHVRGQAGVVLDAGRRHVRLPAQEGFDRQQVQVEIDLARDGSARVAVSETMRGQLAVFWRQQLEDVPEAELERQFEAAYASRVIPGSEMTALRIEGRGSLEDPLVLRYDLRVPSLGRRAGGRLVLPALFAQDLAQAWARLPSRVTTQAVSGVHREVVLVVRAPGEVSAPPDARIEGPGGARFERRTARRGDAVVVRRALEVPRMLVPADGYGAFSGFCRRVTGAEHQEVAARL